MGQGEWLQLDSTTCEAAVTTGNIEILKRLRENGCPWDKEVISKAARNGKWNIVKWARLNGCDWDETPRKLAGFPTKWLNEHGCPG
jgi:hypothetical protein